MRIPSEKDDDSLFQDCYTTAYFMTINSLFAEKTSCYSYMFICYIDPNYPVHRIWKNMVKRHVIAVRNTTTLFCNGLKKILTAKHFIEVKQCRRLGCPKNSILNLAEI